jgi:hypothetical protein
MVARTATDLSAVSRRGPCRCQNFTVTCNVPHGRVGHTGESVTLPRPYQNGLLRTVELHLNSPVQYCTVGYIN